VSEYVLDASALLALVHGEPGAERVRRVLGRAAISAINLAEVVGRLSERGGAADEIRRGLDRLRLTVLPVDEDLGYAAGFLRPTTRHLGLSLGDRVCLALTIRLGATALTADRAWTRAAIDAPVELLRPS
jgi:PIN domain nuclease of toxin-antitoxin system